MPYYRLNFNTEIIAMYQVKITAYVKLSFLLSHSIMEMLGPSSDVEFPSGGFVIDTKGGIFTNKKVTNIQI